MAFFRRFPEKHFAKLGKQLLEAVKENIPQNLILLKSAQTLFDISSEYSKHSKNRAVEKADFLRDEIIRSIALYLKSKIHRRDNSEQSAIARELYTILFGNSYEWINSNYKEETEKLVEVLKLAEIHSDKIALLPEFPEYFTTLKIVETDFEKEMSLQQESEENLEIVKKLKYDFHVELDYFIACIDRELKAYIPEQAKIRKKLLAPLEEAS